MGVLSIVGVNTGTEQLNIVAHGLNTGDGFLRIYTPNGTIPAGLAAVTDYWAIKIDADHIQLADSSAHAFSATPINITGAGSGTLQLLQGLPYAVPRIAAPLTQTFSADDNATWRSLVALWNLLTGQAQSIFSGITLAGVLTALGAVNVSGLFTALGGIAGPLTFVSISPPALGAANNNNYNPTGMSTAVIVRITTAGGGPFLTGIAGGTSGRILYLYNIGADTITVTNNDGSSTAGNRFLTPAGTTLSLATNQSMTWMYDGTSAAWRLVAKNF